MKHSALDSTSLLRRGYRGSAALAAVASLLAPAAVAAPQGAETQPKAPFALIENAGQWDSSAVLVGRLAHVQVQLLPGSIQFLLERPDLERGIAIRLTLEGGDSECAPHGELVLPGTRNYFIGSDSSSWTSGVSSYASAVYEDLSPGVDLRLRESDGKFEWDLLVDAGVKSDGLVMVCEGVDDVVITGAGDLVLETELGSLRMGLPTSWTVGADGSNQAVESAYRRIDARRFGFALTDRDDGLPLVIDPGIEWATYLGGGDVDVVVAIERETVTGNVYVAGLTDSFNFPSSPGCFQPSFGGVRDAFVSVFDPTCSTLLHSTYLGGSDFDGAADLDLGPGGTVLISGYTYSASFPTTPAALQPVKGMTCDAFIARLNADLSVLEYSTFLGDPAGNGDLDWATDLEVDSSGVVTVCGLTRSTTLTVTPGAYDVSHNGLTDMFVARINPAGAGAADLIWSTYLGGTDQEGLNAIHPMSQAGANAFRAAIALDSGGAVTVLGNTHSSNFPTTVGAYDRTLGGNRDAFVARLSPDGSTLIYSTLIGGNSWDNATGLALDAAGRAVVTGFTFSPDSPNFPNFPTPGAFQPVLLGGGGGGNMGHDGFVAILKADWTDLDYGTYLGGSAGDILEEVAIDAAGLITVVGDTESSDYPTTHGSSLGGREIAVTRLDPSAVGNAQLVYSTLSGGSGNDNALAFAVDGPSALLIAGITSSTDFPVTASAYDQTYNGGTLDGFVMRLQLCGLWSNYCGPGNPNSTGSAGVISACGSEVAADNYMTLSAGSLPLNAFGFFLTSQTQGFVANPAGSAGNLCLGGSIGRYVGPGQIKNSGQAGAFELDLDLTQTPTPTGLVSVQPGQTWNFLAWHRDAVGGTATSNFTNGLSITFQ